MEDYLDKLDQEEGWGESLASLPDCDWVEELNGQETVETDRAEQERQAYQ